MLIRVIGSTENFLYFMILWINDKKVKVERFLLEKILSYKNDIKV